MINLVVINNATPDFESSLVSETFIFWPNKSSIHDFALIVFREIVIVVDMKVVFDVVPEFTKIEIILYCWING